MKQLRLLVIVLVLLIWTIPAYAEMTAEEILAKYAGIKQSTFAGKMEMKVVKPEKEERVYVFSIWAKDKDYALIRYLSPAREKGIGCLKIKNDMYMYLPSVEKSIKISAKQQVLSSDFSNADILGIDLMADYEPSLVGIETIEDVECYVLLLQSKTREAVYNSIKVWLRKSDLIALKQEYYTVSGKLLRIMTYEDFQMSDGILTARKMVMRNTLVEGEYTVLTILEGRFNQSIPESTFTLKNLEQGK